MLRLNLKRDPEWIDLIEGVRVKVAPITSATVAMARLGPDAERAPPEQIEVLFGVALGKVAILEWDGVGDEGGAELPVTPEGVEALLALPPIWRAWKERVLVPVFVLDAEKNAFGRSPNGSSEGAPATATGAPDAAKPARPS